MDIITLDDIHKVISLYAGFDRDLFIDLLHENRLERAQSQTPAHKYVFFVIDKFALKMFIDPKNDQIGGLSVIGIVPLADPKNDALGDIERLIIEATKEKFGVVATPIVIRAYQGLNKKNASEYGSLRFTIPNQDHIAIEREFPTTLVERIKNITNAQDFYQHAIKHVAQQGIAYAKNLYRINNK